MNESTSCDLQEMWTMQLGRVIFQIFQRRECFQVTGLRENELKCTFFVNSNVKRCFEHEMLC